MSSHNITEFITFDAISFGSQKKDINLDFNINIFHL